MSLAGGSSKLLSIKHIQLFQPSRAKAETAAHITSVHMRWQLLAKEVLLFLLSTWRYGHINHILASPCRSCGGCPCTQGTHLPRQWRAHKLCCTVVWKYLEFCFHFMVLRLLHRKSALWPNESWALTFLFMGLREGKHSILVKPSIS